MSHAIISAPNPYITARATATDLTNARTNQEGNGILGHDVYYYPIEKCDDQPLDFSKKKENTRVIQKDRETRDTKHSILESAVLQTSRPLNVNPNIESFNGHQSVSPCSKEISPCSKSPDNSVLVNNNHPYISMAHKALMDQLAYMNTLSKYAPIFPKLDIQIPSSEQQLPQQDQGYHQTSSVPKLVDNRKNDIISPNCVNVTSRESILTPERGSPPTLEHFSNHSHFNNSKTFSPILVSPPSGGISDSPVVPQLQPKTPVSPSLEEVSILQRTLTAPSTPQLSDHVNGQRLQKNSKPTRPFKAYNPLPTTPFPVGLPVLPLGVAQDFEDQEYRYQQYMERYYTNKNSKTHHDTRSQGSVDNQTGSSGDDRRESPSTSDSSPRPPVSNQNQLSNESKRSSVTPQNSRRQPADTSTSTSENNAGKRARSLPDELKDAAYWERRRKNNEAAKRSRDSRRQKEDFIAMRARFLEDENKNLRLTVAFLRQELNAIKCCAAHNHNRF